MSRRKADKLPSLPRRPRQGHKGLFGRVLVVGGCRWMSGAAVLAGLSALRCGAGLVQLAVPVDRVNAVLAALPEAIVCPLDDPTEPTMLEDALTRADALVVGPGMSTGVASHDRLVRVLECAKPAVLDADALNLIAAKPQLARRLNASHLLTPHPGEMRRLAAALNLGELPEDESDRREFTAIVASRLGCLLLLKGRRTHISDGSTTFTTRTGDSTLSKAGSGDVLAGAIGSLLAQGISPLQAARAAAHAHGLAGQRLGRARTRRGGLARELTDLLPIELTRLES